MTGISGLERAAGVWGTEPWSAVAETASAAVFFVGDRACKLKKPVNLGFLDYSTAQARAAACAREVELNRRFAPDVYLDVAEVSSPDGRTCDHLVIMRRLAAARRLSALVSSRTPVAEPLEQVARIVAAYHACAPRGPQISEQGSRDAVRRRWTDNIKQVKQLVRPSTADEPLSWTAIEETEQLADRFLAGRARLFDARIRADRIVDGHGDLLADDIFCLDDGPRILDCLDFDDKRAGWTGSMTPRSSLWTLNGWAHQRSQSTSSTPTRDTARIRRLRHCVITMWPTGPSFAPRSPGSGPRRATPDRGSKRTS